MKIIGKRIKKLSMLLSLPLILMFLSSLPARANQQGIKSVKISETKITKIQNKIYTGKKQIQNPVIMSRSYKLILNNDYTLSYKNNINIGLASIIIKGKGKYSGTITRTFHINPDKPSLPTHIVSSQNDENERNIMNIIIGKKTFTATLENNETAKAFVNLFPFSVNMTELNGNEKFRYLSKNLRTNTSSCPDIIHEGDIMLYGDDCLVLFYKTFHTSYSYVKLGHINNTAGLTQAVGSNSVQVSFSLNTE